MLEGLEGGAYVVDEGINDNDMGLARKGWHILRKNITDYKAYASSVKFKNGKNFHFQRCQNGNT